MWRHIYLYQREDVDGNESHSHGDPHVYYRWVAIKTSSTVPTNEVGFDKIMPEGRLIPAKFMPLTGQDLTITFGSPSPITHAVKTELARWRTEEATLSSLPQVLVQSRTATARSRLTGIVQEDLERLGKLVDPSSCKRIPEY
jgi:hypothetical protein